MFLDRYRKEYGKVIKRISETCLHHRHPLHVISFLEQTFHFLWYYVLILFSALGRIFLADVPNMNIVGDITEIADRSH